MKYISYIAIIGWILVGIHWGWVKNNPKIIEIEKVKTVKVNDTYYNGVKVNGDCSLVDPPCWEFDFKMNLDRRSLLRLK